MTPEILIEDNEECIFMVKNQSTSARAKHINIRAHFMREHYMKASFDRIKTDTLEQDTHPLTKNLPEKDYKKHAEKYRNGTLFIYQNWDNLVQQMSNGK